MWKKSINGEKISTELLSLSTVSPSVWFFFFQLCSFSFVVFFFFLFDANPFIA